MAKWYEVAFDRLYPILYRHRDEEEARLAAATFGPLFAGSGTILDLACGHGRHMEAFAAVGEVMVGLDLSSFLLERAVTANGQRGRVVQGDMRSLPFLDRSLAGVINMFTSFGYFESDEENVAVLREAARVLRPGGVFLIDFLNANVVLSNPLGKTRRQAGGYTVDEDRSVSPGRSHLVKHVAVTKPREDFSVEYDERVRLFGADELVAMADGAGLSPVRLYGDYDGTPFDAARSPRVIAACERRTTHSQGGD